jgi:hypothetical protein
MDAVTHIVAASALCADAGPQAGLYTKSRHYRPSARLDDPAAGVFNASMRMFIGILCGAICLAGCASHKSTAPKPARPNPAASKPVLTPDLRPVGKVARVDLDGRFVILSFSPGSVPKPEERLNVYRNGLKVAEVKVDAKWQTGNNTAADIVQGDVQVGDEARQD